ncbi:MAG TPA: hypothetical protein VFE34_24620 [Dongiaceae bacterium]|jgi:hypothetical protein|nr:hypothetical protein [Dongiaceae bacterium]
MATTRQKTAARKNVRKAQQTWRSMSSRAHARSQPEGRRRAKPGAGGGGFYHIEVRPKAEFKTFRTQDVGSRGGIERVAGKRASGSWSTQKWLIAKDHAHVERGKLVGDSVDARKVLTLLGTTPVRIRADRFKAHDRPNVPERAKPTAAQRRARTRNIRKAQAARKRKAA